MKVSIVIPNYKQDEYVKEAVDSCNNQTYKPHEVIVFNDKDGIGLSYARNSGIKQATGDWIVCLDADDTLPPTYLETLSKIAIQDNADIVGCGYKTFGDYEIEWKTRGTITADDLLDGNRTQCSALFKREIFNKVQFDESMKHGWEDWDFWIMALLNGFTMICTDKTYLNYRKHGASMVSHNPEYAQENKKYMTTKYLNFINLLNEKL